MYTERCISSLHHHRIEGQKCGIPHIPEQLGHSTAKSIAKYEEPVILKDSCYVSAEKKISVHEDKLKKYCLNPERPHAKEFFLAGYSSDNAQRLFQDMRDQFDISKAIDRKENSERGAEKFSIPMVLGGASKYTFRTVWANDGPEGMSRFITAYIDRKLKEDD